MTKCPKEFDVSFFENKIKKIKSKLGQKNFDTDFILVTKLILESSKRIHEQINQSMQKEGLVGSAWVVLMIVYSEDTRPIYASDICDFLGESKATVSRVIESLKQKELLVYTQAEGDRRKQSLALTQKGQDFVKLKAQEHGAYYKKLYTGASLKEAKNFLLTILNNA